MNLSSKIYIIFLLMIGLGGLPGLAQDFSLPTEDPERESKFIDAKSRAIIGDSEGAVKIYQDLLKKDPNDHEAAFFLGRIYLDNKDNVDAIKYLALALSDFKENPWYYIYAAEAYMNNDQYDQATRTIESLVKQFPSNKSYYDRLEYLYRDSKQYEKQLELLTEMDKKFGFHKDFILGKIQALTELGREDEAYPLLEELHEKFPADLFVLNLLANHYQKKKQPEKAEEVFRKILKINPGDSRANLALVNISDKTDIQAQLQSLKSLFQNKELDFDTKFSQIAPYFKGRLSELNEEELESLAQVSDWLLEAHPRSPKAISLRADLFSAEGRHPQAVELYKKAVEIHPDNYVTWDQLLQSLKMLRQWDEIRNYADEASIYFPNRAILYLIKGEAEYHTGDNEEALFDLETGLSLGEDDPVIRSNAYGLMGLATCGSDKKESDDFFNQAVTALEKNPEVKYYQSLCAAAGGQIDAALSLIDDALAKAPENPFYAVQKAEILFQSDRADEALKTLQKIPEKTHYFPVYQWMSKIYHKMNEPEKARSYEQKAIKYGGSEKENVTN